MSGCEEFLDEVLGGWLTRSGDEERRQGGGDCVFFSMICWRVIFLTVVVRNKVPHCNVKLISGLRPPMGGRKSGGAHT